MHFNQHNEFTRQPATYNQDAQVLLAGTIYRAAPYLPFKLQHDLLTTVQTLLEEACFYFAQKWLPEVLKRRDWDTPEQGELTAWWNIFKDCCVPEYAVAFHGLGVAQIFRSCREIRNNAVHRNRVSIIGIKSMVGYALQLVLGLKDAPRSSKMRNLKDALDRRDLEELQKHIDAPLGSLNYLGWSNLAGMDNPSAGMLTNSRNLNGANQLPPGTENSSQFIRLGQPPGLRPIMGLQQAGKPWENNGNESLPPDGGLPKAALHMDHPEMVADRIAELQDKMQVDKVSEIIPGPPILPDAKNHGAVEDGRSKKGRIIIDLTEDKPIIDLTQDTDEDSMGNGSTDDIDGDSLKVASPIFFFGRNNSQPQSRKPARVMEPDQRRGRKEKFRKIRAEKRLLSKEPLGARR
jgi:hypothetical protein